MKKITQITLLTIAIVWFTLLGTVLVFGEPTEGEFFDSAIGFALMKIGGVASYILALAAWAAFPEDSRKAIESWLRMHS